MKAKRIARTIFELKSHAVMGGTLMKDYADVIVSESLDDLKELGRLAEIGRATEKAFEQYFVMGYGAYGDENGEDEDITVHYEESFNTSESLVKWFRGVDK